jgi:hypothetical protein
MMPVMRRWSREEMRTAAEAQQPNPAQQIREWYILSVLGNALAQGLTINFAGPLLS